MTTGNSVSDVKVTRKFCTDAQCQGGKVYLRDRHEFDKYFRRMIERFDITKEELWWNKSQFRYAGAVDCVACAGKGITEEWS